MADVDRIRRDTDQSVSKSENTKPLDIFSPESLQWGLALLASSLTFMILMRVTLSFKLPLRDVPEGIVSQVTRTEFEPLTDYLKYIVILVGTFAVFSITYWQSKSILVHLVSTVKRLLAPSAAAYRVVLWSFLLGVLTVALFNLTAADLSKPLQDTFHEGEVLGYLPAALGNGNPFETTFLIHGFGKNILPSLLADHLATNDNRIVLTRLVNIVFNLLAYAMALFSVTMAASLRYTHRRSWLRSACIASLGLIVLKSTFFISINSRDTVFLLQLTLLMGFLTITRSGHQWLTLSTAGLVGASLPLAFLFVYDRAVYMVMVAALVTIPIIMLGRKIAALWLIGNLLGIVLGLVSVVALAGFVGAEHILEQVVYWSRYGRYIWAIPLPAHGLSRAEVLMSLGVSILAQCSAVVWLWSEYRCSGTLRTALVRNMGIVTLLAAAVVFQRIALDRSDRHLFSAAMLSGLLIVALLIPVVEHYLRVVKVFSRGVRFPGNFLVLTLVSSFAIVQLAGPVNPLSAARTIRNYFRSYDTPDSRIVKSDYQEAVAVLGKEVQASSCFFTMTSELAWYYLFDRPSCSRFHHLVFARTGATQEELIAALEREKPPIILFSNSFWANRIDGVSVFNSNAPVARYVMTKYKPYQLIGEHWFWHRTETPVDFGTELVGTLDSLPTDVTSKRDLEVSGMLNVAPTDPEKAAVFVSVSEANVLIWAGLGVTQEDGQWQWAATVPTATLSKGESKLRFWVMTDKDNQLHPLSHEVKVIVK